MGKRGPMTFAKRQREMEAKRIANEKRAKRLQRRDDAPAEPEIVTLKPFVDEEQV